MKTTTTTITRGVLSLALGLAAASNATACSLFADFDRSLLPQDAVDAGSDSTVPPDAARTDGGPDAVPDGTVDATNDAQPDARPDAGADADMDATSDAGRDADAAGDAGSDSGPGADATTDGGADATTDAATDAARDASLDAATDAADASTDAQADADAGCQSSSECDDRNACTTDICGPGGACVNVVETCPATQCQVAATCNPATGCPAAVNKPATELCTDSNACTVGDRCDGLGACVPGAPAALDDGNACTTDTCNVLTGVVHTPLPANTPCDNATVCDGREVCRPSAVCVPGTAPVVDDGNPCTIDSCNATTGVAHVPVAVSTPCDNATVCDGRETCNASGACVPGTAPVVDDGNVCTTDACNATTGVAHVPVAVSTPCDNATVCDGREICNASGACVPSPAPLVDDSNRCTTDACDPVTGVAHVPVAAATPCDNGTICDGREACDVNGVCGAGTPLVVSDGDACTVDACDPVTGVSHTATVVDDGIACTTDACNTGTGVVTNVPNNALCTNPLFPVCAVRQGCVPPSLTNVVISELNAFSGVNNPEFVELFNAQASAGSVAGFSIRINGTDQVIHSVNDRDGATNAPVVIPALGYAFGVPNNGATIPAGAAFVYGPRDGAADIPDTGDNLLLTDLEGVNVLDEIDFRPTTAGGAGFHVDGATAIPSGAFPGYAGRSTQLDVGSLTAAANDAGSSWCVTFRQAGALVLHTRGAANHRCDDLVLSEIAYARAGTMERRAFVEIAGPGGALLTGARVVSTPASLDVTIAAGTRMPVDGIYVIADGSADNGATNIANVDRVVGSGLLPAAPGVLALSVSGTAIDVVGYGAGATGAGNPAPHQVTSGLTMSLARGPTYASTNDNATDFRIDPSPTPGERNDAIAPTIVGALSRSNGLASATTPISISARDFASAIPTFNGTTAPACTVVGVQNDGRPNAQTFLSCSAIPSANGSGRGDFILTNPIAVGGAAASLVNAWTYTGVANETDATNEIDTCTLHSPPVASFGVGSGTSVPVIARVFEVNSGTLTSTPGANAGIRAELGIGPAGTDPRTSPAWVWKPAAWSAQTGTSDDYTATLSVADATLVNTYSYAYRVSLDDGLVYTYCDRNGAGSDAGQSFEVTEVGVLTVTP